MKISEVVVESSAEGEKFVSTFDYDVLIVGSGFRGSVAALRAAEKGYRCTKCGRSKAAFTSEYENTLTRYQSVM